MKLAEALILRADAQRRIEQLRERLVSSAKVQEGEQPPENPDSLLAEMERVATALLALVKDINRTNVLTMLEDGTTIADGIATRDNLMLKRGVYASLAQAAVVSQSRYTRSEVKYISTVNVADIQRRVDDLSQQHRELDASIQAANWNTDLLESA